MSADNWRVCPRCIKRLEDEGRSLSDFEELDDLREDWEILMQEDGVFFVKYSCVCYKCGFTYEYKYENPVSID